MATSNGEEIKRIHNRIDSVESDLFSLVKTTNRNTTEILQRLTAIERSLEYSERTMLEQAKTLKTLTELQQQAKGVTWTFKAAIGLIGALEAWHVLSGWFVGKEK